MAKTEQEMRDVYRFINECSLEQRGLIVEAVRQNTTLLAFNRKPCILSAIESVHINGNCLQLNIEHQD